MLRRLVVTATRHLLEHLVSAYNVTEEEEEKVSNIVLFRHVDSLLRDLEIIYCWFVVCFFGDWIFETVFQMDL